MVFYSVDSVDGVTAWAVGEAKQTDGGAKSIIGKSTDSGKSFKLETGMQLGTALKAVDFVTNANGWIACDDGRVLWTSDAGQAWNQSTANPGGHLYGLHFATTTTGWAVGVDSDDQAVILKTVDGGKTWDEQTTSYSGALNAVFCLDENTAWAVGDEGLILTTVDGGKHWTKQDSGVTTKLLAVDFADGVRGAVSGGDEGVGTLLVTFDGGRSWTERQSSYWSTALNAVDVTPNGTIWAAGNARRIVIEGAKPGVTGFQNTYLDPNWRTFNCIHFVDDKTGFFAGYYSSPVWACAVYPTEKCSIKKSPSKSMTYSRKNGRKTVTFVATVKLPDRRPASGVHIQLQSRPKASGPWYYVSDPTNLVTGSSGKATVKVSYSWRSKDYYRWVIPRQPGYYRVETSSQKITVK